MMHSYIDKSYCVCINDVFLNKHYMVSVAFSEKLLEVCNIFFVSCKYCMISVDHNVFVTSDMHNTSHLMVAAFAANNHVLSLEIVIFFVDHFSVLKTDIENW